MSTDKTYTLDCDPDQLEAVAAELRRYAAEEHTDGPFQAIPKLERHAKELEANGTLAKAGENTSLAKQLDDAIVKLKDQQRQTIELADLIDKIAAYVRETENSIRKAADDINAEYGVYRD